MAPLITSLLTYLPLLLTLFHVSIASQMMPRQSPNAGTTIDSAGCTNYARIANLSTVGSNSTYRAAFLRSAPMGTLRAASILDGDIASLPALQMDGQLNGQCGNLTTIAIQAAATNFTQGTVLGFSIQAAVGAELDGFAMPFVYALIAVLMVGVFGSV